MADTSEKIVIIPLRKGWIKKPRDQRTQRSILEIRNYVFRHTKTQEVKVSNLVNETIWKRGIQKPQGKIKVKLVIAKDHVTVRLPDEKEEVKVAEKKSKATSIKDKIIGKDAAPAPAKPSVEKTATKDEKSEHPKQESKQEAVKTSEPKPETAEKK
jgi:large subunit ribosomal protein L31e